MGLSIIGKNRGESFYFSIEKNIKKVKIYYLGGNMKKVLVIGSVNVDHIINVEKLPLLGETIMGKNTNIVGGGKGANQAVEFSRLGSNVCMLACVGDDQDGKFVLDELSKNNIDISRIKKTNTKTGMASIMVSSDGQNSIVVIPGANYDVTKQYIDENVDKIKESEYIVLQNEIPIIVCC